MRSRRGQVALYLVAVLVAITILLLMNVSIFLAVSEKNRAMNAGDAASLAVARYQGELLNRIGTLNVAHLKAAIRGDGERCAAIVRTQLRLCFLDPIEGILVGNQAAMNNGAEPCPRVAKLLRDHAQAVRQQYITNPELYPEPWEGAWAEYATCLEVAASNELYAGPDNITFRDAACGHTLLNRSFYEAIAGGNWCWFKYHAPGLLEAYENFSGWSPLPTADDAMRARRRINSEVYSLHLNVLTGGIRALLGDARICELTGASAADVSTAPLLDDPGQKWLVFDEAEWRRWWEMDSPFPLVGRVKPEYDVRGCAALCRVKVKDTAWTAGAKPFGIVDKETLFVTPVFTEARLVPIDAVGGADLATADPDWMEFVRVWLPKYMLHGPKAFAFGGGWYGAQLVQWEHRSVRREGLNWLKYHGDECARGSGGPGSTGGTPHGH